MTNKQEVTVSFTVPEEWNQHDFVRVLFESYEDVVGKKTTDMVEYSYKTTGN